MYIQYGAYNAEKVTFYDTDEMNAVHEILNLAKSKLSPTVEKLNIPMLFCSDVTNRSSYPKSMSRKELTGTGKIKKRHVSFDLDYEAGEEEKANLALENFKEFARKYETPIIIYPTSSFPKEPCYRVIFFTNRLMSETAYTKAILWICEQAKYEITDKNDLVFKNGYTLPGFSCQEQADNTFDTTQDENLSPLDTKLFSGFKLPKSKNKRKYKKDIVNLNGKRTFYDGRRLRVGMSLLASSKYGKTYDDSWKVITSIAQAIVLGDISIEVGEELVEKLALNSSEENSKIKDGWASGNVEMLHRELDSDRLGEARHLSKYYELAPSVLH